MAKATRDDCFITRKLRVEVLKKTTRIKKISLTFVDVNFKKNVVERNNVFLDYIEIKENHTLLILENFVEKN